MAEKKLLVIEDEPGLVKLIKYNFEKEGYRVLSAGDGVSGLAMARKESPDLIILDIMLPGKDGHEVCRILRQDAKVPILFLTAKDSEVDRILGFKLGADDYVTKPFSIGELIVRVGAILRRVGEGGGAGPLIRSGTLEIDLDRRLVTVKGKRKDVTPKEFEFLRILLQADGKVIGRDILLERVWGYDKSIDIDTRTVDQHIARMRKKLGPEGRRVETVLGSGYRILEK